VDRGLSELDPKFTPRYLKPDLLEKIGPGEIEHAVPWENLSIEQKRFQSTKMAIHAAMVDRMDHEIGRVLDQLRKMDAWENTLIVFLSDNGADATLMVRGDGHDQTAPPGSASSFLCLGPGWASASNAPFRRHKIWEHEGGIATPGILHWPARITSGGKLRHTPAHVVDFVPTVLRLAGVEPPLEWQGLWRPTLPGKSLVPLFKSDVEIPRDTLYWHHEGNRALRVGDWKLVSESENGDKWELYDLQLDRIESNNLAESNPDLVKEMSALWQQMDEKFHRQGSAGNSPKR
jgi:arylsulfatase